MLKCYTIHSFHSVGVGNMSAIQSHKCPSCAGNLNINVEKQMYYCPFCGSTYDYEYFREEEMHELCNTYLSNGEFKAAIDGFRFILQKDPHDFQALRGLMMCSARISDIKQLIRSDDYEGFSYDAKMAGGAVNDCAEEDREYFHEFGRLYSEMDELSAIRKEYKKILKDQKLIAGKLNAEYSRRENCQPHDKVGNPQDPKILFFVMVIIGGILIACALMSLLFAIFNGDSSSIMSFILLIALFSFMGFACMAFGFKFFYPLLKAYRDANARIVAIHREENEIKQKAEDTEKEIHRRSSDIRHACMAFIKKDAAKTGSASNANS